MNSLSKVTVLVTLLTVASTGFAMDESSIGDTAKKTLNQGLSFGLTGVSILAQVVQDYPALAAFLGAVAAGGIAVRQMNKGERARIANELSYELGATDVPSRIEQELSYEFGATNVANKPEVVTEQPVQKPAEEPAKDAQGAKATKDIEYSVTTIVQPVAAEPTKSVFGKVGDFVSAYVPKFGFGGKIANANVTITKETEAIEVVKATKETESTAVSIVNPAKVEAIRESKAAKLAWSKDRATLIRKIRNYASSANAFSEADYQEWLDLQLAK